MKSSASMASGVKLLFFHQLMSAATVFVCPCCGAAYRQRGTRFSFVADLSGVSVKELMQSMEVTP